jgi:hypothetical protein
VYQNCYLSIITEQEIKENVLYIKEILLENLLVMHMRQRTTRLAELCVRVLENYGK